MLARQRLASEFGDSCGSPGSLGISTSHSKGRNPVRTIYSCPAAVRLVTIQSLKGRNHVHVQAVAALEARLPRMPLVKMMLPNHAHRSSRTTPTTTPRCPAVPTAPWQWAACPPRGAASVQAAAPARPAATRTPSSTTARWRSWFPRRSAASSAASCASSERHGFVYAVPGLRCGLRCRCVCSKHVIIVDQLERSSLLVGCAPSWRNCANTASAISSTQAEWLA